MAKKIYNNIHEDLRKDVNIIRITLDLSEEAMEILKNIAPKAKSMFISACIIEASKKNKEMVSFFLKTNAKNSKKEHTLSSNEIAINNNNNTDNLSQPNSTSTNYKDTNNSPNNDDESDKPIEINF